mmetsp:Transcript_57617/g.106512  ORF Transcript_57617/g.106512 Transcript_57617/m.106512 type:complete len:201 (-) Transcript_57617:23-625(-)
MFCMCCASEEGGVMDSVDAVAVAAVPPAEEVGEKDDPIAAVQSARPEPILPLVPEPSDVGVQPSVKSTKSTKSTQSDSKPPKEEASVRQTESESTPVVKEGDLPPTDFVLTVDRSKGEKLGLVAYNNSGESFLRIRAIKPAGLIAKWNEEHPEKVVRVDFLILSVNGNDTPPEMRRIVTDSSVNDITMTLRRSTPQAQAE